MSVSTSAHVTTTLPMSVDPALLRCPTTGQPLEQSPDGALVSADGAMTYPLVGGVPVLINERASTFRIADYQRVEEYSPTISDTSRLADLVVRHLPSLSLNRGSRENFELLDELVHGGADPGERPRVLIVGAGSGGVGSEALSEDPGLECVETDVALGPRTRVVCDAHDLPFVDGAFDAAVCQAVLEHVLDPGRVVEEIHRVLAPGGLVYSEVPFMQQVHGGAYDVTRFSLLGHRRLYRFFDEIRSGVQGGPGMALGWSLWYFMRTLARTRQGRGIAFVLARIAFWWLKHLDRWLDGAPAAVDAASGTFFLGRRREGAVSDEAILSSYRGAGTCRPH
ncbi:MAG: methyltransferase domain-containing protein [Solirubrobacterales bacterium]|nr:methyltransferase domain-containing protein [Solirubrobacterales bacterium]